MRYFLSHDAVLKWLETPSVYHIARDELYELDHEAFTLLRKCASQNGGTVGDHDFLDDCLREGLLITDRVSASRPPLTESPAPSLRYLELQITDRCNLRCKHCFIGEGSSELSIHHVKDILQEFEEMQGLRVLITGGEPLLHSRLSELCAMLPDFSVRKILLTNGILLNNTRLKTLNVHEIQISIDGLERAHDSLRGDGAYKSAIRGLHSALDAGFEVSVSTMVHPGNLGDFDALERLFTDYGNKRLDCRHPLPYRTFEAVRCISDKSRNRRPISSVRFWGGRAFRCGRLCLRFASYGSNGRWQSRQMYILFRESRRKD